MTIEENTDTARLENAEEATPREVTAIGEPDQSGYESWNRSPSNLSGSDGNSVSMGSSRDVMKCSNFVGAVANLCSATLGAGILALPFAMYESGLVFGLLLLLASGWGTAASINLIVQACDYYGLSTYESVVEKALGSRWRQTVEISVLIFCGGTAVAYVIAVGDIMERVETIGKNSHKRLAMSLVWLMAMLPLSCLRRMQSLQCASSVGILSIGTLLVAAIVHLWLPPDDDVKNSGFLGMQDPELFLWPTNGGLSILRACPIFFFAYSCQVNVAQIYDELPGQRAIQISAIEGNSQRLRNMSRVAWVAIGLCTILYASISVVTLFDFGAGILPNVLSCYRLIGKESSLLHVAFLAMALAVIMAFPLNVFPARLSIIQMWEAASWKSSVSDSDVEECRKPLLSESEKNNSYESGDKSIENGLIGDPLEQPQHVDKTTPLAHRDSLLPPVTGEPTFNAIQHYFVTFLVAGGALGLALVAPNISVVFGLLGGTTSSLLGFVVPGLLGISMERPGKKSIAWILVVVGTVIGVVTTGVTLYSTIRGVAA